MFGLQTNREPQQAIADACDSAGLFAHVGMRHRRWVGNEALDATQRFSEGENGGAKLDHGSGGEVLLRAA